jgi:hypothetical protein
VNYTDHASELQEFDGGRQSLEERRIDMRPRIRHLAALDDMIDEFPSWLHSEKGVIKAPSPCPLPSGGRGQGEGGDRGGECLLLLSLGGTP